MGEVGDVALRSTLKIEVDSNGMRDPIEQLLPTIGLAGQSASSLGSSN